MACYCDAAVRARAIPVESVCSGAEAIANEAIRWRLRTLAFAFALSVVCAETSISLWL